MHVQYLKPQNLEEDAGRPGGSSPHRNCIRAEMCVNKICLDVEAGGRSSSLSRIAAVKRVTSN